MRTATTRSTGFWLSAGVLGIALLLSTAACGSSSNPSAVSATTTYGSTSRSLSSDTPTVVCLTTAPAFSSDEIRSALESASLPAGVVLLSQKDRPSSDDRSKIDVVLIICQPGLVGAQLKDVATILAESLQSSGLSQRILMLLIGNVAEDAHPEGEVRLDDFARYAFSPSSEIRAAWKYAAES